MNLELDEYAHLKSWLHQWEPRYKLVGLMAIIFAFAFVKRLGLIPFMVGVTGLLYGCSGLPPSFWWTRIRYPGYFLLSIVLLLPFVSGSTILWQWGALTVRQEGTMAVMVIASRFLSIITVGLVLFGTTPFLTLVRSLRSLGLPSILADMLLLSYRYLFEIAGNLAQMQRAMRLRGFQRQRQGRGGLPQRLYLERLANLAGTLLVRSYEQAERIYQAMRLRGYGDPSKLPTPSQSKPTGGFTQGWHAVGLAIALLVATSFVMAEVIV